VVAVEIEAQRRIAVVVAAAAVVVVVVSLGGIVASPALVQIDLRFSVVLECRHGGQDTRIQNVSPGIQYRQCHGEFPDPVPRLQHERLGIQRPPDQDDSLDAPQDAIRQEPLVLIGMVRSFRVVGTRRRPRADCRRELERRSRHGRNVHREIHDPLVGTIGGGRDQFGRTQRRDAGSRSPLHRAFGPVVPAPQLHSNVADVVSPAAVAAKHSVAAPVAYLAIVALAVVVAVVGRGVRVLERAGPKKITFVHRQGSDAGVIAYRDVRGTHGALFRSGCDDKTLRTKGNPG